MKLLIFLVIVGLGVGATSGVDFRSIDWQHPSIEELEKVFNSINFGPLSGLVNDMKDAVTTAQQQISKLMAETQQAK